MRAIVIGLLCLTPAAAHAQAFGARAGMMIEDFALAEVAPDASVPGWTWIVQPPQPNGAFDAYKAYIGPNIGLCSIVGIKQFAAEQAAINLAKDLQTALTELYGPPVEVGATYADFEIGDMGVTINNTDYRVTLHYGWRSILDCRDDANPQNIDRTGL